MMLLRIYKKAKKFSTGIQIKGVIYNSGNYSELGIMKIVMVVAVLSTVLMYIGVISAAPLTCVCSTTPVPSNGSCAYCLETADISRHESFLNLHHKNQDLVKAYQVIGRIVSNYLIRYIKGSCLILSCMQICDVETECGWEIIEISVPQEADLQDDLINAQLEIFLGQLEYLDDMCATNAISGNQTLLEACQGMYDNLHDFTQDTRHYVSLIASELCMLITSTIIYTVGECELWLPNSRTMLLCTW